MSNEQGNELTPIEQQIVIFYGKPIIVVRLPDGRPGAVIRSFCENMQIDNHALVLLLIIGIKHPPVCYNIQSYEITATDNHIHDIYAARGVPTHC